MPRSKRKIKKTFFKIKEKLVLIPPKKFVGRRLLGVCLLMAGCLIMFFSVAYFYVLPIFFSKPTNVINVTQKETIFLPERILIPSANIDLVIKEGVLLGTFPKSQPKLGQNDQIIVLGNGLYKIYSFLETAIEGATLSATFKVDKDLIELTMPVLTSPKKSVQVVGRIVLENY